MSDKKLESIKDCIDDQLLTSETKVDIEGTQRWLEGWICGATDNILHPKLSKFKDQCIDYLVIRVKIALWAIDRKLFVEKFVKLSKKDREKILDELRKG